MGVLIFKPTFANSQNIDAHDCVVEIMGRIAVTDGMSDNAMSILENAGHSVHNEHFSEEEILKGSLSFFDAVVIRSATKLFKEQIEASTTLDGGIGFIGRAGVGVDNIDIQAATNLGIYVCNTPSASTRSVVELTMGHLIASTRNISLADSSLKMGAWAKKKFRGTEIGGKNLGILGFGRIAKGVSEMAIAFGMQVHIFDPFISDTPKGITIHQNIEDLFSTCTHITVHCNLTEETQNLVSSELIGLMPGIGADGVECGNHIVSCARGGIVDESAALEALDSGILTSLALDVFENEPLGDSPLLSRIGFHGSPHIAASTLEAQSRIGTEMAALLIEYFDTGKPGTSLNGYDL